jgi:ATP dependent DNA ligase-like protein
LGNAPQDLALKRCDALRLFLGLFAEVAWVQRRTEACCTVRAMPLPKWIKPQLTRLVEEAPAGDDWLHEIKYDGYRMHARIDGGHAQLLTRTGLDWSRRYRFTIGALRSLPVKTAYLDGELCAVRPDGVPAFSRLQAAMDKGRTDELVLFVFDLVRSFTRSCTLHGLAGSNSRIVLIDLHGPPRYEGDGHCTACLTTQPGSRADRFYKAISSLSRLPRFFARNRSLGPQKSKNTPRVFHDLLLRA